MFANFLHSTTPCAFFFKDDDLRVKLHGSSSHQNPERRLEKWIIAGWLLIALKCTGLWWLIDKYHVPIHPLWLVGPTVLFGLLATAVYIWRD